VDSDTISRLLIIYSVFVKYFRKDGNSNEYVGQNLYVVGKSDMPL
jgi:hypothetical protein